MTNDYTISAVVRALGLIKMFDEQHKQMSLTELSARSGLPKSSVLRVMESCIAEGFIRFDPIDKKYRLSIEIFKLANSAYEFLDMREVAIPYIKAAVEESGLVGHLGTVDDGNITIIVKICPGNTLDSVIMHSHIGSVEPAHCTGVGKTLAAFSDSDQREEIIRKCDFHKYTANTIDNEADFRALLPEVRRQGFAINREEHEQYIKCITYPVFDYRKMIVAALSLTGLSQAYDQATEEKAHLILKKTAADIMAALH